MRRMSPCRSSTHFRAARGECASASPRKGLVDHVTSALLLGLHCPQAINALSRLGMLTVAHKDPYIQWQGIKNPLRLVTLLSHRGCACVSSSSSHQSVTGMTLDRRPVPCRLGYPHWTLKVTDNAKPHLAERVASLSLAFPFLDVVRLMLNTKCSAKTSWRMDFALQYGVLDYK